MKITGIKNLDLFKYSLVILISSLVFIFFPFALLLYHYKEPGKSFLVDFHYIFICFGVGVLLLNAFLLFWILNRVIRSNNLQYIQKFETHFFQLLNYAHETASKMDNKDLNEMNFSIKNFISQNMHTFNKKEDAVEILRSTFRSSVLEGDTSASSKHYFLQMNTLLVYLLSADIDIDQSKYIAILESHLI
ncbi:MAG: hypothetical protein JWN78_98 [Bacteroidota bacterium]|nr:hypothetical protein [Bacteroidota bacterium]